MQLYELLLMLEKKSSGTHTFQNHHKQLFGLKYILFYIFRLSSKDVRRLNDVTQIKRTM